MKNINITFYINKINKFFLININNFINIFYEKKNNILHLSLTKDYINLFNYFLLKIINYFSLIIPFIKNFKLYPILIKFKCVLTKGFMRLKKIKKKKMKYYFFFFKKIFIL